MAIDVWSIGRRNIGVCVCHCRSGVFMSGACCATYLFLYLIAFVFAPVTKQFIHVMCVQRSTTPPGNAAASKTVFSPDKTSTA